MKTYQRIITYGTLLTGSLGLFNCSKESLAKPRVETRDLAEGLEDVLINGEDFLRNTGKGTFDRQYSFTKRRRLPYDSTNDRNKAHRKGTIIDPMKGATTQKKRGGTKNKKSRNPNFLVRI